MSLINITKEKVFHADEVVDVGEPPSCQLTPRFARDSPPHLYPPSPISLSMEKGHRFPIDHICF